MAAQSRTTAHCRAFPTARQGWRHGDKARTVSAQIQAVNCCRTVSAQSAHCRTSFPAHYCTWVQQNACYARQKVVSIQAVNRTKVQGKATMNNEKTIQSVGSNPTATTISTRETEQNGIYRTNSAQNPVESEIELPQNPRLRPVFKPEPLAAGRRASAFGRHAPLT